MSLDNAYVLSLSLNSPQVVGPQQMNYFGFPFSKWGGGES